MATYRNNAARFPSAADTTTFRNWITDMVAMLNGAGWVKSTQTGQLDETTVTWPAASNTTAGWQVWYLNDSLHSTYPIYMKLTWGRGASSYYTTLNAQFGYELDGSGNFVGWSSPSITLISGTTTTAATGMSMGCTVEGCGWWVYGRNQWGSSPDTVFLHVAREFDSNGEVVNNGNWCVVFQGVGNFRPITYSWNREFATQFYENYPQVAIPFNSTLSGSATETELWRWNMKFPMVTPMATLYTYMQGDIQIDAPFTCNVSGTPRTYLPTGANRCSYQYNTAHHAAMVWE